MPRLRDHTHSRTVQWGKDANIQNGSIRTVVIPNNMTRAECRGSFKTQLRMQFSLSFLVNVLLFELSFFFFS